MIPRLQPTPATPWFAAPLVAVAALAVILCGTSAWARPSAVISEFQERGGLGAAERTRATLTRALRRAKQVEVIPFGRARSLARAAGVRGAALLRPENLGRFAAEAGADAVVTGSIKRSKKGIRLKLSLLDEVGDEIWGKEVRLEQGVLSGPRAARYAAAIGSALIARAKAKSGAPKDLETPLIGEVQPSPEPSSPEGRPPPEPSVEGPTVAGPTIAAPAPQLPIDEIPANGRAPPAQSRPEMDGDSLAGEARAASRARPSPLALSVAYTMTWRTYHVCPQVTACSQRAPAGAVPATKYTTDRPYGGILLQADLFPLRGVESFVRGFGLGGGFGRSLQLASHYTDMYGADRQFGSVQQRLWGELGYRLTFSLGGGDGWVQARAGYLEHLFKVDPNPKSVVESRRAGFYGALDLSFPLGRYARIDARFALVPEAGPGAQERAAYGEQATGGGYGGTAGLSSDFGHPEWHVRVEAAFELLYFGDRYTDDSGALPPFARAQEIYLGGLLGLRGSL